ncbi:hypothetical protein SAMN05421505_13229 [Sinosporangium album]|uniref:Helix-turn-helix n=1 Tax=Sinosporangium album TaxID=504805 RepID=A0A1G8HHF6_9ACTN|nr:hypothetical protein [Sinosporangium album]SDI05971.1 hypothetical protein SAMN05421505_13229 [Sinosporangium album]
MDDFSAKLRYLWSTTRAPDGGPWSTRKVAAAMAAASGGQVTISHTHVANLLNGAENDPRLSFVAMLTVVFDAPEDYFVCGAIAEIARAGPGE